MNNFVTKVNKFYNIDSDFFDEASKSTVSTIDFNIMSKNDGSLAADNNSDKSFERVHLNVSSNSVDNITGSKLSKKALSSAVENIIDVDVSHKNQNVTKIFLNQLVLI